MNIRIPTHSLVHTNIVLRTSPLSIRETIGSTLPDNLPKDNLPEFVERSSFTERDRFPHAFKRVTT